MQVTLTRLSGASMRAYLVRACLRAALPAAMAGAWTAPAAAQTAQAATPPSTDSDLVKGTLSTLGIIEEDKPGIDYRERAPLVVPPPAVADLPPPKAAPSSTNPNWPKDPDLLRAQQANATDNRPIGAESKRDVLLPSELNKGRKARAGAVDNTPVGAESKRDVLLPSELGFKSWFGITSTDDKPLSFNGEPVRESLTQPPPGYQTPAPNAPYGVVEKKAEPFKFPTLFDRQ